MAAHRRSQRALHLLVLGALALSSGSCGSPTDARSRLLRKNGQILFGRDSAGTYQLYVVDADGTHLSPVPAASIGGSNHGVWSRDGAWIALDAPGPVGYQIDVIDRHGANRRTIVAHSAYGPAWSPDRSQLAFRLEEPAIEGIPTAIGVVSLAGGEVTNLTPTDARNYAPTWSPDCRQIAFINDQSGITSIGVVDATGGTVRLLTHNMYGDTGPAWSPATHEIAYIKGTSSGYELHAIRSNGSGDRTVARNVASPDPPVWSPDGNQLAFLTRVSGTSQIAVVNADGTGYLQLTSLSAGATDPTWSPDGTEIAFISAGDVFVMKADGTQLTNITQTPDIRENSPDWGALPPS